MSKLPRALKFRYINNVLLVLLVISTLAIGLVIHSTIQLQNVYGYVNPINTNTNTTKTNAPEKVAKPLPQELRNEPLLLVHVGKAGGSSLRRMIEKVGRFCQKKTPHPIPTTAAWRGCFL